MSIYSIPPFLGAVFSITLDPKENGAEVSIHDAGCGIEPDKLPHIFDPFYSSKEGGTGLGLAITHSIIEKNRGKIEIESRVGVGTKLKVILPCR